MRNIGVFKKLLMILLVFSIAILFVGAESTKAAGVLDLTNLQDIETLSTSSTADSSNNGTTKTESESNSSTGTTKTASTPTKESTLPKTGSNMEVVYAVGLIALIGTVAYVYKKSTIKLK